MRLRARYAPPPANLWDEPRVYDIFAPTGDFLGRLTVPERASYAASKGPFIWLVVRDDDDVPTVVRYRVASSSWR